MWWPGAGASCLPKRPRCCVGYPSAQHQALVSKGLVSQGLVSQGHYLLACLAQLRGESSRAAGHADQALRSAPDAASRALALSVGCWIAQERGASTAAVQRRLSEARALAQQGGDRRALALILRLQAAQEAYHHADPIAALPLFEQSVHLFEQLGDITQTGLRQIELAHCWAQTGREHDALALLQQCMAGDPDTAGSPTMIYALTEVGRVQLRLRDAAAAEQALQQAMQLALQHDWLALVPPALLLLPQAWLGGGQPEQAALLHGHLLASWRDCVGGFNRLNACTCRRTRGLLAQSLGPAQAARLTDQGRALSREQALSTVFDPKPARGG